MRWALYAARQSPHPEKPSMPHLDRRQLLHGLAAAPLAATGKSSAENLRAT